MFIIQVKEGESLEKSLKKYKRKFDKAKMIRQLRSRTKFIKPSVNRRNEIIKATYRDRMRQLSAED